MIKRITMEDCKMIVEVLVGVALIICSSCLLYVANAKEEIPKVNPMVYLKSSGQFSNSCKVSDSTDYDRAVNLNNISTLRKVEDCKLVVDNNLVIMFKDSKEREGFINDVGNVQCKK